MYVIAPNIGPYFLTPDGQTPIDAGGGQSTVADYRGAIIGKQLSVASSSPLALGTNDESPQSHGEHLV